MSGQREGDTGGPPRGWLQRLLFMFFGPPDLGPEHRGNPLTGTKYDPELKRARRQRRKRRSDRG